MAGKTIQTSFLVPLVPGAAAAASSAAPTVPPRPEALMADAWMADALRLKWDASMGGAKADELGSTPCDADWTVHAKQKVRKGIVSIHALKQGEKCRER